MRPAVDLRVYAVLDPTRCRDRSPAAMAAAAARGGATLIQLRVKHSRHPRPVDAAREVLAALAPFGVPLLINDRVDVALAVGAARRPSRAGGHGVPTDARRLLGAGAIIGATVHHAARSRPARSRRSPTMPGIGPVFATASKAATMRRSAPTGWPG